MDAAGPANRIGRSAAEDLSGRVFCSEATARSRCVGVPVRHRAGGTAAGKKPGHDGFGRPGAVHRSSAGAGDRPRDAQQRTSLCQLGSDAQGGSRARYQVRSTRFTDADMEIVPNGSGSTDELCVVCVDVGENGAAWQRTSRDSGTSCVSLSLAVPEFGSDKLDADLGRAAGQDDDNVFAVLWTQRQAATDHEPRVRQRGCAHCRHAQ